MKASRETWLRLHHFAKVLFVSIASLADGGLWTRGTSLLDI